MAADAVPVLTMLLLIQGTFEVDAVGFEVSRPTAEVASLVIVPGGVCIAGDCHVFSVHSLAAWFGGLIVHFPVYAFVVQASVSLSTSAGSTLSAMATVTISATGVLGRFSGSISDVLG